jgi:hypothetical protein
MLASMLAVCWTFAHSSCVLGSEQHQFCVAASILLSKQHAYRPGTASIQIGTQQAYSSAHSEHAARHMVYAHCPQQEHPPACKYSAVYLLGNPAHSKHTAQGLREWLPLKALNISLQQLLTLCVSLCDLQIA